MTKTLPPPSPIRFLVLLIAAVAMMRDASSCSDFAMRQEGFRLSARNEDFSGLDPWFVVSVPKGETFTTKVNPPGVAPWSYEVKHGYVAFMENSSALEYLHGDGPGRILDGMNEAGLSVGAMTLINSTLPPPDPKSNNVHIIEARNYLLATCANVKEAVQALGGGGGGNRNGNGGGKSVINVWADPSSTSRRYINHHFTLRDSSGDALVVEFIAGEARLHHAGGGDEAAAIGVLTNEPDLPWHARNVELWQWKRQLSNPAVGLPGGFYPDDRFLRAAVLRDAARRDPPDLESAVADAFGVLSSVAVPLGTGVPGTDSGPSGGEGPPSRGGPSSSRLNGDGGGDGRGVGGDGEEGGGGGDSGVNNKIGDHTRWSVVRDHSESGLGYYWRDERNPSVRRLLLKDAFLDKGKSPHAWPVSSGDWFQDAKPAAKEAFLNLNAMMVSEGGARTSTPAGMGTIRKMGVSSSGRGGGLSDV